MVYTSVYAIFLAGGVNLNMRDEACEVAKPLVVAVEELGEIATPTVKILRAHGAKDTRSFSSKYRNLPSKTSLSYDS